MKIITVSQGLFRCDISSNGTAGQVFSHRNKQIPVFNTSLHNFRPLRSRTKKMIGKRCLRFAVQFYETMSPISSHSEVIYLMIALFGLANEREMIIL